MRRRNALAEEYDIIVEGCVWYFSCLLLNIRECTVDLLSISYRN
jgi:hypothetical protein